MRSINNINNAFWKKYNDNGSAVVFLFSLFTMNKLPPDRNTQEDNRCVRKKDSHHVSSSFNLMISIDIQAKKKHTDKRYQVARCTSIKRPGKDMLLAE